MEGPQRGRGLAEKPTVLTLLQPPPTSRELGRQAASVSRPDGQTPSQGFLTATEGAHPPVPWGLIPPHVCTQVTRSLLLLTFESAG